MIQTLISWLNKQNFRITTPIKELSSFRNTVIFVISPTILFPIVFENNGKTKNQKNFFTSIKIACSFSYSILWSIWNSDSSNWTTFFNPVNYYSRTIYVSRNCSSSRNIYSQINLLVLVYVQIFDHILNLLLAIVTVIENSTTIELHHIEDTLIFLSSEETLDLIFSLPLRKIVGVLAC